ncbi:MAG: hypothetical protein JXL80_06205 [Planctomycetes bacterium]|nr:hypothetical protein [Planctomycetota bacterium]
MSSEGLRLEPLGLGQLFDRSVKLYRGNLRLILALSGLAFAVTFLLTTPQMNVVHHVFGELLGILEGESLDSFGLPNVVSRLLLFILTATITSTLAEGLVIQAAGPLYLGRSATFRESLMQFLPKVPKLILTRLIALVVYGIVLGLGIVAMGFVLMYVVSYLVKHGVPNSQAYMLSGLAVFLFVQLPMLAVVLWLFLCWVLLPAVVVIEGKGYLAALLRSASLIRRRDPSTKPSRHMSRAAVLFMALTAIYGSVHSVLLTLYYTVGFFAGGTSGSWRDVILGPTHLSSAVTVPFVLLINACDAALQPLVWLAMIALYFDIRVRHEGYDLERVAERLAATGS